MTWICVLPAIDKCWAIRCGAPLCACRTMNMSAFIAARLSMVSSSVSPLVVEDTPMFRLITSAESRLAAISKVVRVRVLFSKNRLKTVLPRKSGTFFTSRSTTDTKGTAVSRMRPITWDGRSSSVRRCCSCPSALSCGLCTGAGSRRFHRQAQLAVFATLQHDRRLACDGETRSHIRGLDRQLATAAIDQHRELDGPRPSGIEELVDRRAHRSAGIEHVVDQHDVAAVDIEGQRSGGGISGAAPCGGTMTV